MVKVWGKEVGGLFPGRLEVSLPSLAATVREKSIPTTIPVLILSSKVQLQSHLLQQALLYLPSAHISPSSEVQGSG